MSKGIWSAVSGAMTHAATLDVVANDLANAGTAGYRGSSVAFKQVMNRAAGKSVSGKLRTGTMRGTSLDAAATDSTQGAITLTGRPLDVAIRGKGFIAVQTAEGPRYTRQGSFLLAKDGTLVTKTGDPVMDVKNKPIKLDPNGGEVHIGAEGSVMQKGEAAGKLQIVEFANEGQLTRSGALYYAQAGNSGPPTPSQSNLEAGALECSNVSAVKGMMSVMQTNRSFEACEKIIQAFRDADSKAIGLMRG